MGKTAVVFTIGMATVSLAAAIVVAKAQIDPRIWYGWILTNRFVVPGLLALSAFLFFIALREWHHFRRISWLVFTWVVPANKDTDPGSPVGSGDKLLPTKIPKIIGDFSDVKIIRHGLVVDAANGQQWMMAGFDINASLNSSEPVHINDVRLRTHKMTPPCRPLLPYLPPQVTELEANVSHNFRVYPQIEYWYDRTKNLPSSLEMIVTDKHGAEHQINLRLGQALPLLPDPSSPLLPPSHLDPSRLRDVTAQMSSLSKFEVFALAQLILKGGMAGSHFYDIVNDMGFPIDSRAHQNTIMSTFTQIGQKTTFLNRDGITAHWGIKTELIDYVAYLVDASRPIIGLN